MHPSQMPPALAELVALQDGVMTRAQAMEHGLTSGQVEWLPNTGWQRLMWGIYSCQGAGWRQHAWAGVLGAGDSACIGGLAAAYLHGFHEKPAAVIDIWTPKGTRASRQQRSRSTPVPSHGPSEGAPTPTQDVRWRYRRGSRKSLGSPARTTAEETIIDLSTGAALDDLTGWVTRAIRQKLTTTARIRGALGRRQRHAGRTTLLRVLTWVETGVESPLELRYIRDVERAHGLPTGRPQISASHRTRTDIVYDQWSVLVELDGVLGHRGIDETKDARRDARHLALRWLTLRFGWPDVAYTPCGTAQLVSQVLRNQGWTGTLKPCPRCGPPSDDACGEYASDQNQR